MAVALEGDLKDFSLLDLINLIAMSKKKGALIFRPKAGDEWRVYFDEGKAVHVSHGEREGEKVLENLVTLKEGPFLFDTSKTTDHTSIFLSHEDLIFNLTSLQKTWEEIKGLLPHPDADLEVGTAFDEIVLSSLELRVLLLVHSRRNLKTIMEEEDIGIRELQTLPNLIRAGLVKVGTTFSQKVEVITQPKDVMGVKLSVIKSFSSAPDIVQIDRDIINQWAEKKLFNGRIILGKTTLLAEPKPKLGKALIIFEKTMKSLGIKEGEEVEVKPFVV